MEIRFQKGDKQNSTRCVNISVFDDMITDYTNYFKVSLTTNDTGVHVLMNNSTVYIQDNDCEFMCIYVCVAGNDV